MKLISLRWAGLGMRSAFTFSAVTYFTTLLGIFAPTISQAAPARNVILFIGDGMGFEHVKAARCYNGGPLSFEGMPFQGQMTTYSANNAVTDSAAAGTAMATGMKVNNYVVSIATPGTGEDLPTSLEYHKAQGKRVGLVTTTYLTHATPATFGAHTTDRNNLPDIASDYLSFSRPDILFGGGGNGLTTTSLGTAGYKVVTDTAGFLGPDFANAALATQFGSSMLPYEYDYLAGTYPYPHLSQMVTKALAELGSDPEGFFLMVEGGLIDQAAHANDLRRTLHETLEYSRAVQLALNWAAGRGDTLILVVADHETGGLTVTQDNGPGAYPTASWSTVNHSAANVPMYAWGQGAGVVSGVMDNTDVFRICTGQPIPVEVTLVPTGATWKYHANGTDLGTAWQSITYDDSSWPWGSAQLGYGDGDEATVIPITSPVYPTYYFRHTFEVSNPSTYQDLSLRVLRDDGAVVYVNGNEVTRLGMPTGPVTYNTLATVASDYDWDPAVSIGNHLVPGLNVVAVEVHQGNTTSSDLSLDLELTAEILNQPPTALAATVETLEDTEHLITLSGSDPENDPLTYAIFAGPTKGTLTGTPPEVTYKPNSNVPGPDSFSFTVNDGVSTSEPALVSINVSPVNDAPVAIAQANATPEDTALMITLTGSDVDGDALDFILVDGPDNGSVTVDVNGDFVYTPSPNFSGADGFTFKVNDGLLDSAEALVSITVTPVNDAPAATSQTVATAEDTTLTITLTGVDVEGASLTYTTVPGPLNGTLTGTPPNMTYIPSPNFFGSDSVVFTVSDGEATSEPATVTIMVLPVNDAPVVVGEAGLSAESGVGKTIAVLANDLDPDGDTLSVTGVTQGSHGSVVINPDSTTLTYTASASYEGPDAFTYMVSDGRGATVEGTVTLTVIPLNHEPVAANDSFTTDEDVPLVAATVAVPGVLGNDSDEDSGQTLTAIKLSDPSNGTLIFGADGTFTYTPTANFNGTDSFTYKVSDGLADSGEATVTITVTAVNDVPVAVADSYSVTEDAALTVPAASGLLANDTDVESQTLTVIEPGNPTHGTVMVNSDGSFTYTPAADFNGTDSFTYKASDGADASTAGTVSITVSPVNDAPLAVAQSMTVAEDGTVPITLGGTDKDGDALNYTIIAGPAHGTLSGTAPSLTYSPEPDYYGADEFSFRVNDGAADSTPTTVSLTITAVNDPPSAPVVTAVPGDNKVTLSWSASTDTEGSTVNYVIFRSQGGQYEQLSQELSTTSYDDTEVENGVTYYYVVQAGDGSAYTDSSPVSATPEALDYSAFAMANPTTTYGTVSGDYTATWSSVDGQSQTITEFKSGLVGYLDVLYTLQMKTVTDPAQITGLTLYLAGAYTDYGDPLKVFLWQNGSWADISGIQTSGSHIVADPRTCVDVAGQIRVRFTDSVAVRREKLDVLTIDLLYAEIQASGSGPVNHPPTVTADTATTTVDAPVIINVLANDSDPDGNPLTITGVGPASSGVVSLNADGTLTYQPAAGFTGTDSFTYTIADGQGGEATGTVTVTVNPVSTRDTIHVAGITLSVAPAGKSIKGTARVGVVNQSGAPVANAQVTGDWFFNGNLIQGGATAIAGPDGVAALTSPPVKGSSGTFTFRVTNVVLEGADYNPAANVETEKSFTYP